MYPFPLPISHELNLRYAFNEGRRKSPSPYFPFGNQPRLVWLPNLILENPIGIKGYICRIGSEDFPRPRTNNPVRFRR